MKSDEVANRILCDRIRNGNSRGGCILVVLVVVVVIVSEEETVKS